MLRRIFCSLKISFYLKNYFFGLIIYILLMGYYLEMLMRGEFKVAALVMSVNLFLFPFATLMYEVIRETFLGEQVFIMSLKYLFFLKAIVKLIIFFFSIPLGCCGILYIIYKTRRNHDED